MIGCGPADPGLAVQPGTGAIIMPPARLPPYRRLTPLASVCSGTRSGLGFGSRRFLQTQAGQIMLAGQSSPHLMKARIAVGAENTDAVLFDDRPAIRVG